MSEKYEISNDWIMYNEQTGERIPVHTLIVESARSGWQKAYVSELCRFIGCAEGAASKVLVYLIKNKNTVNTVYATYEEIAEATGVSKSGVQRVFNKLKKMDLIRTPKNGRHQLDSKILCNGNKFNGVASLKLWKDAREAK